MEYFGTTETFDPCFDFSWVKNLKKANIIITKRLTHEFIGYLTQPEVQKCCILHLTDTGLGGSILEPLVPDSLSKRKMLDILISKGFPIKQVVLRLSPIIPTHKGLETMYSVFDTYKDSGISRIRFSTLNMYPHVKDRFRALGIKLPYNSYSCPQDMRDDMMNLISMYFDIDLGGQWVEDKCAEIDLTARTIERLGCISQKDLDILGVQMKLTGKGKQRNSCLCPNNKRQIIDIKKDKSGKPIFGRCDHSCLYCYWKDSKITEDE